MYPKKRHLDLIEAWPMIHAAHPEAVLVMVGGGPMYGAVRARARELGDKEIRILGRVPEGEDYSWIGAADVSVMCGGLGLAIQQSMAFGRPMVVADEDLVSTTARLARHGETGCGDIKGRFGRSGEHGQCSPRGHRRRRCSRRARSGTRSRPCEHQWYGQWLHDCARKAHVFTETR